MRAANRPVCPVCWVAVAGTARGNIAAHFDTAQGMCPASGQPLSIAVRRLMPPRTA